MAHHVVPVRTYLAVLAVLMALLVLTVAASFVDFDRYAARAHLGVGWSVGIALLIAVAKGLLILLFFMHVKYSSKLTWVFAGAAFIWLGILFTLTFSDYLTRNHPADGSYRGEPRYVPIQATAR